MTKEDRANTRKTYPFVLPYFIWRQFVNHHIAIIAPVLTIGIYKQDDGHGYAYGNDNFTDGS